MAAAFGSPKTDRGGYVVNHSHHQRSSSAMRETSGICAIRVLDEKKQRKSPYYRSYQKNNIFVPLLLPYLFNSISSMSRPLMCLGMTSIAIPHLKLEHRKRQRDLMMWLKSTKLRPLMVTMLVNRIA